MTNSTSKKLHGGLTNDEWKVVGAVAGSASLAAAAIAGPAAPAVGALAGLGTAGGLCLIRCFSSDD